MEIEASNKQIIESYISKLGVKSENIKSINSHELINYYKKKND